MNHKLYQKKIKKEKISILLIQISLLVFFFALWEILARVNIIDKFLFSCPSEIILLLIENIKSSEIFIHIRYSLLETLIALFIGTFSGILIAILLYLSEKAVKILDPFLVVLNALPKTALAPILIVWAGTGIKGIVVVAISLSLIMTIISALNFFNSVDITNQSSFNYTCIDSCTYSSYSVRIVGVCSHQSFFTSRFGQSQNVI